MSSSLHPITAGRRNSTASGRKTSEWLRSGSVVSCRVLNVQLRGHLYGGKSEWKLEHARKQAFKFDWPLEKWESLDIVLIWEYCRIRVQSILRNLFSDMLRHDGEDGDGDGGPKHRPSSDPFPHAGAS